VQNIVILQPRSKVKLIKHDISSFQRWWSMWNVVH